MRHTTFTTLLIIVLLAIGLTAVSVRLAYTVNDADSAPSDETASQSAIECIMTRRSIRSYTPEAISDSAITTLLKAGMAAPTAVDLRPWEFVVITDTTILRHLGDNFGGPKKKNHANPLMRANVAIAVCGNLAQVERKGLPDFWVQDCSAASENILLAAHSLGLGAVWCGVYPIQERISLVKKELNLPDSIMPLNVIALGHPKNAGHLKDKWDASKVHHNAFQ